MAFNEILVGRLNRYVQKLLVIKNTALRTFSPDLQLNLSIQSGNEDRYLQGWARFATTNTVPAVAAQFSIFQLRNPANSNIVAVIEKIGCQSGANEQVLVLQFKSPADAGTLITPTRTSLDLRQSSNNPTCIISMGSQASVSSVTAQPTIQGLSAVGGNVDFIFTPNQEWTVLPGDVFMVQGTLANTQLAPSVIWRERPLESSELT